MGNQKENEYQDYDKVIRDMISSEIKRQHSFLNWHAVVQAFLFSAIVQFDKSKNNYNLFYAILFLGIVTAILALATYFASETKIKRLFYFWDGYLKFTGKTYFDYPPVWANPNHEKDFDVLKNHPALLEAFGLFDISCFRRCCLKFIYPKTAPLLFVIAWLIIIIGSFVL